MRATITPMKQLEYALYSDGKFTFKFKKTLLKI